jgi:cyclopropane fatty-acyl-phospholipid synthase-like methyltransferase
MLQVTGIDLTQAMLDKLSQKHPDKDLHLICASYFDYAFGTDTYDAAVSFETMHHFEHEPKQQLYAKIHAALKNGGSYIECDYMVQCQEDEDFFMSENRRIREEMNIPPDAIYHYDTPCTVETQSKLLLNAGFSRTEMVFREGNTTIIVAYK